MNIYKVVKNIVLLIITFLAITTGFINAYAESTDSVSADKPSFTIYYWVSDGILSAQNTDGNIEEARKEFEETIRENYSNRFNILGIKQFPHKEGNDFDSLETILFNGEKPNENPFIIIIQTAGIGQRTDVYQNAFGAKKYANAQTIKLRVMEGAYNPKDDKMDFIDYGNLEYSKGTNSVGKYIFNHTRDPRINVKDSVKMMLHDVCRLNPEKINRYVNPQLYEIEVKRFKGDFSVISLTPGPRESYIYNQERVDKFTAWASQKNPGVVDILSNLDKGGKMMIINVLIARGIYNE